VNERKVGKHFMLVQEVGRLHKRPLYQVVTTGGRVRIGSIHWNTADGSFRLHWNANVTLGVSDLAIFVQVLSELNEEFGGTDS